MYRHNLAIAEKSKRRAGRGRPGSSSDDAGLWRPDALSLSAPRRIGRFEPGIYSMAVKHGR
jgi:hypothetical protein